ncbi:MAG: helix-turn-helix transcriptional regulator, partial [Clostridia bacterium]|nr:helix-turn-helix transcriptional regulator [Clostridia bacterium]
MTDRTIIGQRIAELRKSKGLTQAELADLLGVTHQAVSQWERSETLPDILTLPKIAEIFNENINVLLGLEEAAEDAEPGTIPEEEEAAFPGEEPGDGGEPAEEEGPEEAPEDHPDEETAEEDDGDGYFDLDINPIRIPGGPEISIPPVRVPKSALKGEASLDSEELRKVIEAAAASAKSATEDMKREAERIAEEARGRGEQLREQAQAAAQKAREDALKWREEAQAAAERAKAEAEAVREQRKAEIARQAEEAAWAAKEFEEAFEKACEKNGAEL